MFAGRAKGSVLPAVREPSGDLPLWFKGLLEVKQQIRLACELLLRLPRALLSSPVPLAYCLVQVKLAESTVTT